MNKFIKNLDKIRPIARNFVFIYKKRFQEDELINAAYLGFLRAARNNPELVDSDSFRVLYRAKRDMMDYIRVENETRNKYQLNFINTSFSPDEETNITYFEPEYSEDGFEKVDNEDFLSHLFNTVSLSDDEWHIIQGYFYDNKTLKELGQEVNRSEPMMCNRKKKLINKLKVHALKEKAPIF